MNQLQLTAFSDEKLDVKVAPSIPNAPRLKTRGGKLVKMKTRINIWPARYELLYCFPDNCGENSRRDFWGRREMEEGMLAGVCLLKPAFGYDFEFTSEGQYGGHSPCLSFKREDVTATLNEILTREAGSHPENRYVMVTQPDDVRVEDNRTKEEMIAGVEADDSEDEVVEDLGQKSL